MATCHFWRRSFRTDKATNTASVLDIVSVVLGNKDAGKKAFARTKSMGTISQTTGSRGLRVPVVSLVHLTR